MNIHEVKKALKAVATAKRAKTNAWFFKTGKDEYGEGDEFIGVTVPDTRKVAKQFVGMSLTDVAALLQSPIHEHRLTALLILVEQYKNGGEKDKKTLVRFYLSHIDRVNNWDLVDLSALQILGVHYLEYGGEKKLYTLAKSRNLWRRRVGIVATWAFIRAGQLKPTLDIAELLLHDKHDLIHKAVGWMLREMGKKDVAMLRTFLKAHAHEMPRTMLRYSIERLPEVERKKWLKVKLVK